MFIVFLLWDIRFETALTLYFLNFVAVDFFFWNLVIGLFFAFFATFEILVFFLKFAKDFFSVIFLGKISLKFLLLLKVI